MEGKNVGEYSGGRWVGRRRLQVGQGAHGTPLGDVNSCVDRGGWPRSTRKGMIMSPLCILICGRGSEESLG